MCGFAGVFKGGLEKVRFHDGAFVVKLWWTAW
jgi:hypothetical protein